MPASSYQQFDADLTRDVPAESYGGWRTQPLPLSLEHTALVVMHAWDCGTAEQHPGWFRAVEYLPRSYRIAETVFPPLLAAARDAGLRVVHVIQGSASPAAVERDDVYQELAEFRRTNVFPGAHNTADIGTAVFLPQARPRDDEGVAATSAELHRLGRGINHLIYVGFAIDGCLLTSPGGMVDMSRLGFLCSTVRDAVTAIENKESARHEAAKEIALWRVALHYGFVYESTDLIAALRSKRVAP